MLCRLTPSQKGFDCCPVRLRASCQRARQTLSVLYFPEQETRELNLLIQNSLHFLGWSSNTSRIKTWISTWYFPILLETSYVLSYFNKKTALVEEASFLVYTPAYSLHPATSSHGALQSPVCSYYDTYP